jgi:hypothetical protein
MPEEELLSHERRELCRIHKVRLDGIDKKIEKIDVALNGNGHPENGVLWMATTNKKTLDWVAKIVFGILVIVSGNIAIRLIPEIAKVLATGKL